MNVGWFRVNRKLFDNEIWFYEPFTKGQAWLDLFGNANHKEGSFEIRGNLITIQRGQIGWSEVTMAKRWKWSRNKVRRYLKWLETIQQIKIGDTADDTLENKDNNKGFVPKVTLQQDDTKSTPKRYSRRYSKNNRYLTTIITICNYDKYQNDTADDTAERQQTIQQTIHKQERIRMKKNNKRTIKQVKKYSFDKKEFTLPEVAERILKVFNEINKTNYTSVRLFIGNLEKCLKNHSILDIVNAIKQIPYDNFWGKINTSPEKIFRQSKDGQPKDYVEDLLNSKKKYKRILSSS